MRRIAPVLAIAALAIASLSACAAAETGKDVSCSPYRSGAASSTIEATGKIGAEPKIDFPTPLNAKGVQLSAITRGDGAQVQQDDVAAFTARIELASTGQTVTSAGYDDSGAVLRWTHGKDALAKALVCQTVGSRVAMTATVKAAFGEGALAQQGIPDDTSLVFVIDVVGRYAGKADGVNQLQTPGLPSVVTATDGQPGIVLPGDDAPTKKTTATVKAGGGATVHKGDNVLVQYTAWSWGDTASVNTSTWDNGSPQIVPAGETGDQAAPFSPQLVGKKIGTQLIQVLPASASGGTDAAATIVVVDVLGVVK
ncbi:hypothetical protein [Schumannella sp. 10F1B-5-1]|uniref:hypothetical protein n=1 Tax=Schumannella sp. 10F1B-5-1 TaxID=2590780 RepID=UPI0011329C70|nr:hypothetical protein [Schumannella sp. 10F1B-5-1]TPW70923.1 hypothetical protein FJ658_12525 [Schumannella sp. 10F1B-5-1]